MKDREEVADFIRSSFRSVWSIEIVLLLRSRPQVWMREEIVAALRASDLVVNRGVRELVAAGLVDTESENLVIYRPVNPATAELVTQAERLYRSRPDHVRRLIVSSRMPALNAFSEAFRLRGK